MEQKELGENGASCYAFNIRLPSMPNQADLCLFVFLALQPTVVVFSEPGRGL